jgi:hypothetical protein
MIECVHKFIKSCLLLKKLLIFYSFDILIFTKQTEKFSIKNKSIDNQLIDSVEFIKKILNTSFTT